MPNDCRTWLVALLAATCVSLLGATVGGAAVTVSVVPTQICVPVISISPCGGSSSTQPTDSGSGESRLLVRLRPGFSSGRLDPLLSSLGVTIERSLWQISVLALRVPAANEEQVIRALQRHPDIEEVEEEAFVSALDASPDDAHWPGQWGVKRAGFPTAWATTRGSAKTIVAVVDTGVETSHPDLRAALLPGRDFVDEDRTPSDEHGHGTAVAGVLAARTNNHAGIAGVCWNCRVLSVRVLDRDGSGDSATLAAGIIWAVDQGADVINLSLGGDTTTIAEDGALAYAARHDVVVVAAAGNEGNRTREYPAADRRVIAVAASDPSDRLYPWSNRGEWVDISAPGCNTSPWRGGNYATFCGTSSATPLVAGLAALIRSVRPRATGAEIVESVLRSASPDGRRLDAARAFPVTEPKRRTSPPARGTRLRDLVSQRARAATKR
jgi:subtilisin family serine protease